MDIDHSSYGPFAVYRTRSEVERITEEVRRLGFSILSDVVSPGQVAELRQAALSMREELVHRYGHRFLSDRGEADVVRAPLLMDSTFRDLAINPEITRVVQAILGDAFKLHLQNVIVNRRVQRHHQAKWHRDLPYADYVVSKPISVSVLVALDDFSSETGSTEFLAGSHLFEDFPSTDFVDRHRTSVTAPAGSAIIFNSMAFHRAGFNLTVDYRCAVNHVYTVPYLDRQIQLNFSESIDELSDRDRKILDDTYTPSSSVDAFIRSRRVSG